MKLDKKRTLKMKDMGSRDIIERSHSGLLELATKHEHPDVVGDINRTFHKIKRRDLRKKRNRDNTIEDIHRLQRREDCGTCQFVLDQVNADLIKMWGFKDRRVGRRRK